MGGHQPIYGRHLEETDLLYSQISRASIDTLKEFYRKDVTNDEWQLIIKLKPLFDIWSSWMEKDMEKKFLTAASYFD
jgi:translation initiation factor 5B